MNNLIPDLSEKRLKKGLLIVFYLVIGLLIIYFIFKKRTPAPVLRQLPEKIKKEDRRPRLSVAGSLVNLETLSTVSKLGRFTRIHLVFKVDSIEEEQKIKEMLGEVSNLALHRVLFCETLIGYKAIIRQLSPKLHIEDDIQCANEMSSYVNAIAIVNNTDSEYFYQIPDFKDCQRRIIHILTNFR